MVIGKIISRKRPKNQEKDQIRLKEGFGTYKKSFGSNFHIIIQKYADDYAKFSSRGTSSREDLLRKSQKLKPLKLNCLYLKLIKSNN